MDYFRILNLKKEPFSNSPEPEFFYRAGKHEGCLQKLELAIRLRRGLNIVIGEVGTGKTTLCRQLILKMGISDEDREQIECHLILDPSFSTPLQFPKTVGTMLGVADPDGPEDEWQLKESIKKYLFDKGVDQGRIVVLIVDEGQKIPEFCIELLREFLNYETNQYKLLQIVIFAQKEFQQFLREHSNFADRVNQYYFLEAFNFSETRRMIQFRLAKASESSEPPGIFTAGGVLAVYRATHGYPRKINTLCHQVVLTLIVQNKPRAGWFLVRSVVGRVSIAPRNRAGWAVAGSLAVLILLVVAFALGPHPGRINLASLLPRFQQPPRTSEVLASVEKKEQTPKAEQRPVTGPVTGPAVREQETTPTLVRPVSKKPPESLGKIRIKKGGTLWWMFTDIYGTFDINRFKMFARANPHIRDPNSVKGGELINFPALPVQPESLPSGTCWVRLTEKKSLDEVYQLLRSSQNLSQPIRLFPYWSSKEGIVYALFLRNVFTDRTSALNAIQRLPAPLTETAKIMNRWEKDTIFFSS